MIGTSWDGLGQSHRQRIRCFKSDSGVFYEIGILVGGDWNMKLMFHNFFRIFNMFQDG